MPMKARPKKREWQAVSAAINVQMSARTKPLFLLWQEQASQNEQGVPHSARFLFSHYIGFCHHSNENGKGETYYRKCHLSILFEKWFLKSQDFSTQSGTRSSPIKSSYEMRGRTISNWLSFTKTSGTSRRVLYVLAITAP